MTAGELGGEGKPTGPTEWDRNDGFSPGQHVLTYVPGLDLSADVESFAFRLTVDGPTTVRLTDATQGHRTLFDGRPLQDDGLVIRRDGRDIVIALDGAGTWAYTAGTQEPGR